MNNTHQPVTLEPLHGVELFGNSPINSEHNDLPFHLYVTISYNNELKPNLKPIWTLVDEGQRYSSLIELYKEQDEFELKVECEGQGSFIFDRSQMSINWQSEGTGFEHYLQSLGLACWLELQGVPCIHANAITLNNNAALVIAPSRTGKSTLTTHLLTQGFKLMTDDMAAIHTNDDGTFTIYPSWPKIRLWPDVADNLVGTKVDSDISIDKTGQSELNQHNNLAQDDLPQMVHQRRKVHQRFAKYEIEFDSIDSSWEKKPSQLKAIYYLERFEASNEKCEVIQINASAGLMVLLQNSMLADAYVGMGIEVERLKKLATILESVPIFKLRYPSGLEHLDDVGIMLKKKMNSL